MKILIVSQYYFPEQFQINEVAPELVKRGHEVTVLTGLPNYPQGEIYPGYQDKREELIEGVRVLRVPIHPRKHGPLHLIWNYVSYARKGTKAAKSLTDEFDLILAYQLSPVIRRLRIRKSMGRRSLTTVWTSGQNQHRPM